MEGTKLAKPKNGPEVKPRSSGWAVVDVGEWLGLDESEMKVIDLRVALVIAIKQQREASGTSQAELAKRVGTTQPNIAKIEAGGIGVSLDLLMRVYFATGGEIAALTLEK